ncbi:hypothetical protein [Catenovulum adriaticum]|uniref:Uncharacterized protein n=1 Tax=Catenovulum adriaticum TaxID=2984846 RepID=A0ABY7AQJ4_9ALTE|nr:hypothetical protein [Catenovulum sp. TS8]WAJ71406.1 hypothetical protein OLW01_06315 [Catenovulum sp. TS8]
MQAQDIIAKNLQAIIDDLAKIRIKADLSLLPKYPYFGEKPYPLGRCLEIRDQVFEILKVALKSPQSTGLQSIVSYMQQGHQLTKIWGGLRDLYFQNAMLLGDYYIDVSNDTVNPNKPRVEITLMKDSGFSYINDFQHFAKIAEVYWQVRMVKNTVCTSLAPFMPLLCIGKNNKSWLAANDVMIKVAQQSNFEKSEQALLIFPEPNEAVKLNWQRLLAKHNIPELNNKHSEIEYCQHYRQQGLAQDTEFRNKMVTAFMKIN